MISIIVLSFGMVAGCFTQEKSSQNTRYLEIFSTGMDGSQVALHIRPEGRYREIKGSPYLYNSWLPGGIMLKEDSIGAEFSIRYNVYGNEMQFISKNDTFAIANPLKVNKVNIGEHHFEYLPFNLNGNDNMAWFEVINTGKNRLLIRYATRMEGGMDPVTPYHCQNSSDRFVTSKYYYYQTVSMDSPQEIPTGRKAFLSLQDFNRPNVKDFVHNNKIKLHKEEDLRELFTWMNK